jgi:hypothetical protein
MATSRIGIRAVISGVMLVLGLFVAGRLFVRPDQPLTGTVVLDAAFAFFFLARGALYFWTMHRRSRG